MKNPDKSTGDKLAFFRQSGWLVIATVLGGMFMSAVHVVVSKPLKTSEYAVFNALLRVFLLMGFPAGGLQVMFAQQAAAALSGEERKRLSQTTRAVLRATFLIWLLMGAAVFFWRDTILAMLKIANPAALWVTVVLGLASLWVPVFKGILQGSQNFSGLGTVLILDGFGRFTATALIVHWGGQAAGAMSGALIGQLVSLSLAVWLMRRLLTGAGAPFEWAPWLSQVIPLTFGVGVVLFMCSADVVYVQTTFSKEESPFYAPAAMIGLAMISFTTPLAAVMFPKIVHSIARTEKTDALKHALVSTALLGIAAAVACTLLPDLPLRIIYFRSPRFWSSAPLIPWFAWCLLPLIVGNVLVNGLLARRRFQIVPWLIAIAVGYGVVLLSMQSRLVEFEPDDVRDSAALANRVQKHDDAVAQLVFDQLPANRAELLSQEQSRSAATREALAGAMNKLMKGPSIYREERFARIKLSEAVEKLLASDLRGRDVTGLNRLLLHDAFATELRPSNERLFGALKKVIGTLGVFSSLLLGAALWFSFRRTEEPEPAGETRSKAIPAR